MIKIDRPARLAAGGPGDAPELAEIHALAFARSWTAEELIRSMAGPGAFSILAARGDATLGFVIGRAMGGEAEIVTLAVRPNARRSGVARALVEAAVASALALGAAVLWLEVAVDNTAALALYAATAFETAGRRKAYYARDGSDRVDALVMRRALNTAEP